MATQVTPSAAVRRESLEGLASQGLTPSGEVHWNFVAPELVEAAIRRGEGRLAEMGPFVAVTSPHTGRSPNDKFVVQESSSEADVDWGKVNQPMARAHYEALKADVKDYLNTLPELFVQDLFCGADPSTRLSVRYVMPNAWHASFVRNMFIRPAVEALATFAPNFTVYHAPEYQADPAKHGTRTGTFIVHVPYHASPAAVMSMRQGDTQMASLAPLAVIPQVKAGKLKAIAVTTRERSVFVPEVPTCRESGLPEIEATAWIGVVVPARTPTAIVNRLNAELVGILKEPVVVDKLRAVYMEPAPGTPQAFAAFMQEELRRWTPVIQRAGVTID